MPRAPGRSARLAKPSRNSHETGEFDLIVMGSHGHNALSSLVMGSVATKVLANCSVPVLLVR